MSISSRRRGFAYFVFCISHFVLLSPLVGRNNIGRRSSVHAVRARPLLIIKKYKARRATRGGRHNPPPRGVNPETRLAPGLRPTLYPSVGLVATLLGLGLFLSTCRGLRPCLSYFAPMRGLSNSAGIRPRVRYFFAPRRGSKSRLANARGLSHTTTNL